MAADSSDLTVAGEFPFVGAFRPFSLVSCRATATFASNAQFRPTVLSMHTRELVDVAAVVALNAPQLAAGGVLPDQEHVQQYWSTSKCRSENWNRALKSY